MITVTLDDLLLLCDNYRITVDYASLNDRMGLALQYEDDFYIALDHNVKQAPASLKREYIAHEIAHCVLCDFYLIDKLNVMHRRNASYREARANRWVIDLFLPATMVSSALQDCYGNIYAAAEELQVTYEFLQKAIDYHEQEGRMKRYFKSSLYN